MYKIKSIAFFIKCILYLICLLVIKKKTIMSKIFLFKLFPGLCELFPGLYGKIYCTGGDEELIRQFHNLIVEVKNIDYFKD